MIKRKPFYSGRGFGPRNLEQVSYPLRFEVRKISTLVDLFPQGGTKRWVLMFLSLPSPCALTATPSSASSPTLAILFSLVCSMVSSQMYVIYLTYGFVARDCFFFCLKFSGLGNFHKHLECIVNFMLGEQNQSNRWENPNL